MSNVASAILSVVQEFVSHIFLVPGANIEHFLIDLIKRNDIVPIVACHELGAGYMADGYSRISSEFGFAMGISSPGAMNLLGAAAVAKADSSPVFFITGNIPFALRGLGMVQDGWAEGTNDSGVFQAAIGASRVLDVPENFQACLSWATENLAAGKPTHVMVPLDVQNAPFEEPSLARFADKNESSVTYTSLPPDWLYTGHPLLAIGHGALKGVGIDRLRNFVRSLLVPVITDAASRGIVPENEYVALGHIGYMPHPRAINALQKQNELGASAIACIGVSDLLQNEFFGDAIPRYRISPEQFCLWLNSDYELPSLAVLKDRRLWLEQLRLINRREPQGEATALEIPFAPLFKVLTDSLPQDTIFVSDAGQIRKYAAAHFQCLQPKTLLSADGSAPLGWGICAAIGAQLAAPTRTVVAITGDGSMRMHGMELATAARYSLPILYVVCDNQGYGSIVARQKHPNRLSSLAPIDWCSYARSLGLESYRPHELDDFKSIIGKFVAVRKPLVLVVRVPMVDPDVVKEGSSIAWLKQL